MVIQHGSSSEASEAQTDSSDLALKCPYWDHPWACAKGKLELKGISQRHGAPSADKKAQAQGSDKGALEQLISGPTCYEKSHLHFSISCACRVLMLANCVQNGDEAVASIFNFPCKFRAGGAVVFHPSKKELNNNGS